MTRHVKPKMTSLSPVLAYLPTDVAQVVAVEFVTAVVVRELDVVLEKAPVCKRSVAARVATRGSVFRTRAVVVKSHV